MNWIGAVIGAFLGSLRGGGILGGIIGAVAGNWIENEVRSALRKKSPKRAPEPPAPDTPSNPYETLGCRPEATDDEVCRAYREKAKRLHPDTLRAQGLPDEIIAAANEQMSRVNAAWNEVKRERRL
jgi:DnaJ-domain-containing protein 1